MTNRVKDTYVFAVLIIACIREMKSLALQGGFVAKQELNGVTVLVEGDSDVDLLFRDQQRAQAGWIEGPVGPYPKVELSADDLASDKKIDDANKARWAEEGREGDIVYAKNISEFFAKIKTIRVIDPSLWNKGIVAQDK